MTLQGLLDSGTIQRKAESSSYGRLVGSPADLITEWKCRISKDYSAFARAARGRGGREAYNVVGERCSETIVRGDVLVIDEVSYEIIAADLERSPYGGHHWFLQVEKEV